MAITMIDKDGCEWVSMQDYVALEDTNEICRDEIKNKCGQLERADQHSKELEAHKTRLQKWVSDLQGGMYVNCVYCGHRYGPNSPSAVTQADVLKAHIESCTEHPMFILKKKFDSLLTIFCFGYGLIRGISKRDDISLDLKQTCEIASNSYDKFVKEAGVLNG